MFKFLKILFPFFFLVVFFIFTNHYYKNNIQNFSFLENIDLKYILILLILGFNYLLLETSILKLIVIFNKKNHSFLKLFCVINSTYFLNSFIQFSGLGFRAYYLKKKLDINYSDFLSISIFIILIELFVFSLVSFSIIKFYELNNDLNILNLSIEIFLILIFLSINIFFILRKNIFFWLKNNMIFKKFNFVKKIILIFDNILQKNFKKIIPLIILIFFLQFIIITLISAISFNLYDQNLLKSFLFGVISAMSIDLSFIFSITPYSIGISEIFILYSTTNFNLNLANILSAANSFRFSLMFFYFVIAPLYFFLYFSKKNNFND